MGSGSLETALRSILALTLLLMVIAVFPAFGGEIHPALDDRLKDMGPEETISVIVHLQDQADIKSLNQQLRRQKTTRQQRHATVIQTLQQVAMSQDYLLADLETSKNNNGIKGYTSYWIANLVVVNGTAEEIYNIAYRNDVGFVEANFTPQLIAPERKPSQDKGDKSIGTTAALEAIRATDVWQQYGFHGEGRLLGSLDTGVDGTHPALASRWRGNFHPSEECWLDVLGTNTTTPNDGGGHGTHTTGTMCGVAEGDTIGVAWAAQWIATNAINQGANGGFTNDIIASLQWFADPDGDPFTVDDVPDAICNSWGVNENFSGYYDCDTRWYSAIDNCEAAGVVTVWAAGNEGPYASTLRSPADRATSLTNTFSVGAVNGTNYGFPFPIWSGSSRGPSGCSAVNEENRIKPEVSAPGENVYSSVPGGGYEGGWTGTSMATPHVTGLVALMRQANPNLDVDTIKEIIMSTARDEGLPGDDNTYGWGVIDALAAITASLDGYATLTCNVTNSSYGNLPVVGAVVSFADMDNSGVTDNDGLVTMVVPAEVYEVSVNAPGFATFTTTLELEADLETVLPVDLVDNAGPEILNVTQQVIAGSGTGPFNVTADIADHSTVVAAYLNYSVNGSPWEAVTMAHLGGSVYGGDLPDGPGNSQIDYYVSADDGAGLTGTAPLDFPTTTYALFITEVVYSYAGENPLDNGWQLGITGDTATAGQWVRVDPIGTIYLDEPIQPEDDHSPNPGTMCFVTGNGAPGGLAVNSDVDGGCTTLLSPVFDLSSAQKAFVSYYSWYAEAGYYTDDQFEVAVSNDGGSTWTDIDVVVENSPQWKRVAVDLSTILPELTSQIMFRFLACDLAGAGIVEAAVDDFTIETYTVSTSGTPDLKPITDSLVQLQQNHPNPFNPRTAIGFAIPQDAQVELVVYGLDGRRIKTLVQGSLLAGDHEVFWDGTDGAGMRVSSGAYFYQLRVGNQITNKRMLLVK
jgi:hypothetical protein